ncbi:hypothetical protein ACFL6E_07730 [Candidatus Neomarinimicrobiota bacterium]
MPVLPIINREATSTMHIHRNGPSSKSQVLLKKNLRFLQFIIRPYLIGFIAVGCTPRPAPVPVEQARIMETRIFDGEQEQVMKAIISSLQDLRYSIEVLDGDLGIIVASTSTEGRQTKITEEPDEIDELSTGQKFIIFAVIAAVVIGIIALFSGGNDDDDNDRDDHRWHGGSSSRHSDRHSDGPTVYEYRLNINITPLDTTQVQVRVSGSGKTVEGDSIQEAGAIEDPFFFEQFFSRLEETL